jgi:hypothetical protein
MDPRAADERLFAAIRALEARVDALARRVDALEGKAQAAPPPPPSPESTPFGPIETRADVQRHANAVNRALKLLGILPAEETVALDPVAEAKTKRAMEKAMDMFGIAPRRGEGEVVEPIPPPEFSPPPPPPARQEAPPPPLDLGAAIPVALEAQAPRRDYAAPILNALVLLAALGAGLFWAAERSPAGFLERNWRELFGATLAALLASPVLFRLPRAALARGASAGASALALQASALSLLARTPWPPAARASAQGLVALAGLALVVAAGHPLALFLGLLAALPLPALLAPGDAPLLLGQTTALLLSVAAAARRLGAPQAGALAAAAAVPALLHARALGAAPGLVSACGAAGALALLAVAATGAPRRAAARSNALLALISLALLGWTVHAAALPREATAGALFCAGLFAALLAARQSDLVRGALKAGAVVLVLTALPVGFEGPRLVAAALVVAALFGFFALLLADAYLRAAGALVLVGACALLVAQGPNAALAAGAALVAALLYRVRPAGSDPVVLRFLLGGIGVVAAAAAIRGAVPPDALGFAYFVAALAGGLIAARTGGTLADAGAACMLAAGVVWAAFGPPPPSPEIRLAAAAATAALLALLRRPFSLRGPSGLYLVLAELLVLLALFWRFEEPGGALAAVPLVALLALPRWGIAGPILATHARILLLALLVRLLLVEAIHAPGGRPFLDLPFLASAAGAAVALLAFERGRRVADAVAILAAAVVGLAAWHASAGLPLDPGALAFARGAMGIAIATGLWARGARPSSLPLRLAAAAVATLSAGHALASPAFDWDPAARAGLTVCAAAVALWAFVRGHA